MNSEFRPETPTSAFCKFYRIRIWVDYGYLAEHHIEFQERIKEPPSESLLIFLQSFYSELCEKYPIQEPTMEIISKYFP